jgi:hypothetical protein
MLQESTFYIALIGAVAFVLFLLGSLNTTSLFEGSEHDGVYNDKED